MNILLVYYSMSGNTDFVAKKISEIINSDLLRIEPEKTYPDKGFKKYFWGGKSAVMGEKPKLKPYNFDYHKYDIIIFGTPVWASNMAPPLRTFISENIESFNGKKFALFLCSSGGGTQKVSDKVKAALNIDSFLAETSLIDPKIKFSDEVLQKIDDFCKEFPAILRR